ncbi:hypothetical protein [Bradyrhizobium sp.]|jgi:hypothetical protein
MARFGTHVELQSAIQITKPQTAMAIPPIAFRVLELTFADRPVPAVRAGVPPNELPGTGNYHMAKNSDLMKGKRRVILGVSLA